MRRPEEKRFEYSNRSLLSRLLVGARLKTSLSKNSYHHIPYRRHCTHLLVLCLLVVAVVFTPSLMPAWLGYEWATARDLCQNREAKLADVHAELFDLANISHGKFFVANMDNEIRCINESATRFYHGPDRVPPRVLWPHGCTREHAAGNLTRTVCEPETRTQKTECANLNFAQKAIAFIGRIKRCKTVWIEPVCTTTVDKNTQAALLSLADEKEAAQKAMAAAQNETLSQIDSAATANKKMKDIIAKLVQRVDIASNLYIAYTIISLLFARPLVVYKRGTRTRLLGATVGVGKKTFTLGVVIAITLYDSLTTLLQTTNMRELIDSFRADPCWIDPDFSKERGDLISATCKSVTQLHVETSNRARMIDDLFYDLKLFGLCTLNGTRFHYPPLSHVEGLRDAYRSGELRNPASCNVSLLNEKTRLPNSSAQYSVVNSVLGSGVASQLLAKVVISNVIVYGIALIEPMTFCGGRVEMWGSEDVLDDEEASIIAFARDKNLLPFIIHAMLLLVVVGLTIFSGIRSYVLSDEYVSYSSAATSGLNFFNTTGGSPGNVTCHFRLK